MKIKIPCDWMSVVSSDCLKTGVKTERPKNKNLKNTVEGWLGMTKNYNMKGEITVWESEIR